MENKNLEKVKIEKLSKKDLKRVKGYLDYINSLIEEGAQILFNKKFSLKEEKKWLEEELSGIQKKKTSCFGG